MIIATHEAWLCQDCGLIVANDDDSGIEDAAQHREDMRLHGIRTGFPEIVLGNSDADLEFSRIPCDGCGTTLAGYRFAAVEFEHGTN
jgi:hypothetical protein